MKYDDADTYSRAAAYESYPEGPVSEILLDRKSMIKFLKNLLANHKPSLVLLILTNVAVGVYTFQPSLKYAGHEAKRRIEENEGKLKDKSIAQSSSET